ncbi:hypothetical protein BO99DRAFT_2258 [Aspergillus violaceofuscus CBS 115571]|uniref:ABM domain-containing protein n=1 Tax=Aspergillus violaceofuscus (strain CBS 115571) TaxID=1450538 RepID=A0A2V5I847_ASPV1|nr:hypothetical protein BO99DRAFT_2258 [Aspergillus violaceofuscus CBS 115571]
MIFKYRPVTVITELQVPQGLELDAEQWAGYFQPLVHAEGHRGTVWGRSQKEPGIVLLVTLWDHPDELRNFQDSPCNQLFRESLLAINAIQVSYHEAFRRENWFSYLERSFVQLLWVYLPAAMTSEQKTQLSKFHGIHTPALGPSIPASQSRSTRTPHKIWATQTESWRSQEARLMLWAHFWRDEKAADFRFYTEDYITRQDKIEALFDVLVEAGALEWKEDFYQFHKVSHL